MDLELEDFLRHCRLERRLADLTCSAYERDVRACLRFFAASGVESLGEVTTPRLALLVLVGVGVACLFLPSAAPWYHSPRRSSLTRA